MFLKTFLMFSCLVFYTASMPTSETSITKDIDFLKIIISKINCSNLFIQKINWTHPHNICPKLQNTFCQINKALNDSSYTECNMQGLPSHLNKMQGNATCTLADNGIRTNMEEFLKNFESYLTSLRLCYRK